MIEETELQKFERMRLRAIKKINRSLLFRKRSKEFNAKKFDSRYNSSNNYWYSFNFSKIRKELLARLNLYYLPKNIKINVRVTDSGNIYFSAEKVRAKSCDSRQNRI